jgi:hypothetical protein
MTTHAESAVNTQPVLPATSAPRRRTLAAPRAEVEVLREARPLLALVEQGAPAGTAEQGAAVLGLRQLLVQGDRRGLHAEQVSPPPDVGGSRDDGTGILNEFIDHVGQCHFEAA